MASETQEGKIKRPGRIRSALAVLFGRSVTPQQIQEEWLSWEITLTGVLDRFSALLARQAKAEKKRVEKELTVSEQNATGLNSRISPNRWDRKATLYSQVAGMRGLPSKGQTTGDDE